MSQVLRREEIVLEILRRLRTIQTTQGYPMTVTAIRRNPDTPGRVFPCVNLFELEEGPATTPERGGRPHTRMQSLKILLEFWVDASVEEHASSSAVSLYQSILWAIFKDGESLGGLGVITKGSTSRLMKPKLGDTTVAGMGVEFSVQYVEQLVRIN